MQAALFTCMVCKPAYPAAPHISEHALWLCCKVEPKPQALPQEQSSPTVRDQVYTSVARMAGN